MLPNPYTPGAGTRPDVLAGRHAQLALVRGLADQVDAGRQVTPTILTGLRGLGKTSLLQVARDELRGRGWLAGYYEARRDVGPGAAVRGVLEDHHQIPPSRLRSALGSLGARIGGAKVGLGATGFTFEVSTSADTDHGDPYGELVQFFRAVGSRARDAGVGVALLVDELQVFRKRDLAVLIQALGAVRDEPVVLIGAGLPYLASELSKANTYAERFRYEQIDFLDDGEVQEAVRGPALNHGIVWSDDAVAAVARRSQGYPFFVQLFASEAWNHARTGWGGSPVAVDLADVDATVPAVQRQLDAGLYAARYDRLSEGEREYVGAMVALLDAASAPVGTSDPLGGSDGRIRSGDVADRLGRTSTQLAAVRDRIIKKGIIHSPRHNQLDFSVPGFDDYVRRRRDLDG